LRLTIFDLDWTLIDGDSGFEWPLFLADIGVHDRAQCEALVRRLDAETRAGTLDMEEYLRFQLDPLSGYPREVAEDWRAQFLRERAVPLIKPGARPLVEEHLSRSDSVVIITGTSRFVAEPIAAELGVRALIATDAEEEGGRFTGKVAGVPCFKEGKVTRLETWLGEQGLAWECVAECWFYSDSGNDIPLLSRVDHPVAVDPGSSLRLHAEAHGWPITSLK